MSDEIDDLTRSMSKFEAAVSGGHVVLPPTRLERILVALDGSNQDANALALAGDLGRRSEGLVAMHAEGEADVTGAQKDLFRRGAKTEQLSPVEGAEPFERILAAAKRFEADLIVLPSPFLRDLTMYGHESIGDTLELLLARAGRPLLVIRDPRPNVVSCLDDVLIPITFDSFDNPKAAAWSLAVVRDRGTIRLLEVADAPLLKSAAHLLGEHLDAKALDPDILEQLLTKEHGGLVAALQKMALERNLACKILVRVGNPVSVVTEVANEEPRLIVTSCPTDRKSADYQKVQAFLRESRNPVLVV